MIQRPTEKDRSNKGQQKRTDDTKAKRKGQMIQRPTEKDLFFSFDLCIICPFLLAFVSSVLFLWPLYHLSWTDDTKAKRKGQMISGQKKRTDDTKAKGKGQMIQRPK
jgi:hypothetical protein